MPKKRKTRKEKVLNEQKRQAVQNITPSMEVSQRSTTPLAQQSTPGQGMTFSLPSSYNHHTTKKEMASPVKTTIISTADYGYLGKDLIRTTLISGAIVLAELLIRLFYLH